MCGFLGKISKEEFSTTRFESANEHNICRGPDSIKRSQGRFSDIEKFDSRSFYCFLFNRLSIIDLSEEAMQPMTSEEYKTIILFNGEIYNHRELRSLLENKGIKFKTSHSDTEVLLNGFSYYGPSFVERIIGQFAIVFVDVKKEKLFLIRDRVGQKPLYYTIDKKAVSFSSNLKSLIKIKENDDLNERELVNYLNFGVVPSPNTLFKNISKLEPASIIEVDFSDDEIKYIKDTYWKIGDYVNNNKFDKEEFFNIFFDSVRIRLESDVPIASFASGGLDSTAIIKALYDMGNKEINTFSITNYEQKYDESKWSNAVAEKYKTNHTQHQLASSISDEDIFKSIDIFDDPYSDPSTVPSYILSKGISSSYKVAISGDGGDELLGGYERLNKTLLKKNALKSSFENLYNLYPAPLGTGNEFLNKSNNIEVAYPSFFEDLKLLGLLDIKPENRFSQEYMHNSDNPYKDLLISDYKFYLYEMMTHKIDRTSMANSLEVRSPFLDHRLIEYIIGSENSYYENSNPKKIIKDYLIKDFDKEFIYRKKQGFVFNLEGWVYNNLNIIQDTINEGTYINSLNKNIIRLLSIRKSRINGQRIWRLFFLERYLRNILM